MVDTSVEDRATDSAQAHAAEHSRQYLESDGTRVDHPAVGRLILLYTTGRVSGEIRRTPVRFFEVGDDLVIAASYRGSPTHPDWYLNLEADPKVWVRLGARLYPATAQLIEGVERDQLWESVVVTSAPRFAEYQAATERVIPLVRLVGAG